MTYYTGRRVPKKYILYWNGWAENTHLLSVRKSITVQLTSCLSGLYSTNQVNPLLIQHKQSSLIQTWGQLYSDSSPYKVSEYSQLQQLLTPWMAC